jgi:hypothetical protein
MAAPLSVIASPGVPATGSGHPGCEHATPRQCVALAITAMGGADKLAGIHSERLEIIEHRSIAEQSYRQAPFLTAYARIQQSVNFDKGVVATDTHNIWPESDVGSKQADSTTAAVATPRAAVVRTPRGDKPGSIASIEQARTILALGPARLLLTAEATTDLHFMPDEVLRDTPHTVVAFAWHGVPVKVLINRFNQLPDAVESTRTFDDFWFAWGDVTQRIYFGNWKVVQGIVYPTTWIEERNGLPWRSSQVLDATFNLELDNKLFTMDRKAAAQSAEHDPWKVPFDTTKRVVLAPGIDFYQGSWSVTIIKQDGGVLLLEAPISPSFTKGALAKARELYPSLPISGVLTTSDSWPHMAGVREAVAEQLPVYALDLNLPILKRMVAAQHTLRPDDLQTRPEPAHWVPVSGRLEVGSGANRVVLYPLRGASTGRQYMVYFPARKLLYASDTMVLEGPRKLYDPELMREVLQAVERDHLQVETVYAMHQAPVRWRRVVCLLAGATGRSKAQSAACDE